MSRSRSRSPTHSEIASLPSDDASTSTTSSTDDQDALEAAEREWRESLEQVELVLTMVLIPYLGKYFGRKAAYWAWAKWMEWKFPVEIVVTSPSTFRGAGAVEAAASL